VLEAAQRKRSVPVGSAGEWDEGAEVMINQGVSESQEEVFQMRQASRRLSYHRWYSGFLRKIKSVTDCHGYIANRDIPDSKTIVTVCTTWQTVVQISGKSSTGSVSGDPGMGAIRTTSPAETYRKDGKVRWATASRLYPWRRLDVIAKRAQRDASVYNWHDSPRDGGSESEIQRHSYRGTSG